jgi:hypothetical protein
MNAIQRTKKRSQNNTLTLRLSKPIGKTNKYAPTHPLAWPVPLLTRTVAFYVHGTTTHSLLVTSTISCPIQILNLLNQRTGSRKTLSGRSDLLAMHRLPHPPLTCPRQPTSAIYPMLISPISCPVIQLTIRQSLSPMTRTRRKRLKSRKRLRIQPFFCALFDPPSGHSFEGDGIL